MKMFCSCLFVCCTSQSRREIEHNSFHLMFFIYFYCKLRSSGGNVFKRSNCVLLSRYTDRLLNLRLLGDLPNYYYGPGHPMKPQRLRLTHNLLLTYKLYRFLEVYVCRCSLFWFFRNRTKHQPRSWSAFTRRIILIFWATLTLALSIATKIPCKNVGFAFSLSPQTPCRTKRTTPFSMESTISALCTRALRWVSVFAVSWR